MNTKFTIGKLNSSRVFDNLGLDRSLLQISSCEKFEDTKWVTISRKTKRTKEQTMICKTLHRKLTFEQHEPPLKSGVNSGAPEG